MKLNVLGTVCDMKIISFIIGRQLKQRVRLIP